MGYSILEKFNMKAVDEDFLEELKKLYTYDPERGVLVFNQTKGPMVKGDVAGGVNTRGYVQMRFMGKIRLAHRLIWLYVTGEWPVGVIDHKDGNKANNKWENLRDASGSTNSRNRKINKNNMSGYTGVSWNDETSSWRSYICVDGKMKALGSFRHKEDAIFSRMTAEKKYGYWLDKVREEDLV